MARRLRKPPIIASAAAARADNEASIAASPKRTARILIGIALAVFLIFEISVVVVFHSDSEIQWQRELTDIDATFRKGDASAARDQLLAFGERWPKAKPTRGWNEKMGLYSARAGDWQSAAKYYVVAVNAAPKKPRLHAFAGEALYKSGDKKAATEMLTTEVEEFDPGTGDHDRANFYLGAIFFEEKQPLVAFMHFQAIANRDEWAAQLKPFYDEVEKTYIQPARDQAKIAS
ncbi:MAG: hypothetical protein ABI579_02160 [Candidatus Sumerlaeota bacterium]